MENNNIGQHKILSTCQKQEISQNCQRRLLKDLKNIQDNYTDQDGISACPSDNNNLEWQALIVGPEDTIWEGGLFKVQIKFPDDYPNSPPKCYMRTKGVVHPNICPQTGWICLDLFKDKWSPAYNVASFLISIRSIFNEPNLASMANIEAGKIFSENYPLYKELAMQAIENSLMDDE